jgi:hypothetical protein
MNVTRKSSDLPALGVSPNSIPAMTDHTVSRTRVWDDMASGRLPYKVVGKSKRRIITTADAIKYIAQLPDGPAPKADAPSEDTAA